MKPGLSILSWEELMPFRKVCVIATGRMVSTAIKACKGLDVGLYNARSIRPLDMGAIGKIKEAEKIITVEDGVLNSGLGIKIASLMNKLGSTAKVILKGVPNRVIEQGTVVEQDEECGLTADAIRQGGKEPAVVKNAVQVGAHHVARRIAYAVGFPANGQPGHAFRPEGVASRVDFIAVQQHPV